MRVRHKPGTEINPLIIRFYHRRPFEYIDYLQRLFQTLVVFLYHARVFSSILSKSLYNEYIFCLHFLLVYVINSSAISPVKKNIVPVGQLWKSVFISARNWWTEKHANLFMGSVSNVNNSQDTSDFFLTFLQIQHKFFCFPAYLLFCMGNYATVDVLFQAVV